MRYEHADATGKKQVLDELTTLLCQHAAIEELVFYPRLSEKTGNKFLVNRFLLDHQNVKEVLYWLNSEDRSTAPDLFDATIKKLKTNLDEHKVHEEATFSVLRRQLSASELAQLDKDLKEAEKTAPTRPHPMAPVSGMLGQAVQKGTGMVEQMMGKAKEVMEHVKNP